MNEIGCSGAEGSGFYSSSGLSGVVRFPSAWAHFPGKRPRILDQEHMWEEGARRGKGDRERRGTDPAWTPVPPVTLIRNTVVKVDKKCLSDFCSDISFVEANNFRARLMKPL